MGLIFEINQPFFLPAIHIHRDHNTACVNLIRFLLICELSFRLQLLHGQKGQVHQADKLVVAAFIENVTVRQIFFIGSDYRFFVISFFKFNMLQLRGKGGMTAVIRPVGIQHTDLCHGRITFFFVPEIILYMLKDLEGHS